MTMPRIRSLHALMLTAALMIMAFPGAPVAAQPLAPAARAVQYGSTPLAVLDVYLPEAGQAPYPVVMTIRGSDFNRYALGVQRQHFLEAGYAVLSIDYRLDLPAAVHDGFCAWAWAQSEGGAYDLDADRMVVFGHSLGGLIAATMGTMDDAAVWGPGDCPHTLAPGSRLAGVITYGGALLGMGTALANPGYLADVARDLRTDADELRRSFETLTQVPVADWPILSSVMPAISDYARSLPATGIDGGEPPFLLIHGTRDRYVPLALMEDFAAQLEAAGVPVETVVIDGVGHEVMLYWDDRAGEAAAAVDAFLLAVTGDARAGPD
jgi:acetyl esterase/lipase